MQAIDAPRTLLAFAKRFPDDAACAVFLATLRWPTGFRCPCGGTRAWHHASRPRVFQCASCRRQFSVTAGTIMHRAKVPLVEWFWAAWAFAQDKRGVSALQLSRVLGRRYETVWRLLHKVRDALAEDPKAFPLEGVVEVDETYTGGKTTKDRKGRSLKDPRRGLVVLATERKVTDAGDPGIRGSGVRCGDTRMAVVESAGARDLLGFLATVCAPGTTVRTDGWSGYGAAAERGFAHVRIVEGRPENGSELFPLVHTLFANMKAWINGTFHGVSKTWLPAYVKEFAYRLNRRHRIHEGELWTFALRRLVRGSWRTWAARDAEMEPRRAA
jgi:transposase-like protein